jgi:hypothetical protein
VAQIVLGELLIASVMVETVSLANLEQDQPEEDLIDGCAFSLKEVIAPVTNCAL